MFGTQASPRRPLRLNSIDDALQELDRIEIAHRRGALRAVGGWTPGQIIAHIAAWIEYGWDGDPVKPPPFPIRWVMKRVLPRILRDGMKPGVKIPGVAGGTTGAEPMETQAAIDRLRAALIRLSAGEPAIHPSPAFGMLSRDDHVRLQLRHAELHLSFLQLDA